MTTQDSHIIPANYRVRFLFITRDSPYSEEISISDGREMTGGKSDDIALDHLPHVGEIVVVPGSNTYWTIAGILMPIADIRSSRSLADEYSKIMGGALTLSSATLLLIDQAIPVDAEFPDLYVGWEDHLVGVIGSDLVFRVLSPAAGTSQFSWGYEGTGPQNLAKSILFHHMQVPVQNNLAAAYCLAQIAPLAKNKPFVFRARDIEQWLRSQTEFPFIQ
jgi:hypothetical protein